MSVLPTGILTFLFTDLEDSTALWDQNPEAAHAALARHDALIEGTAEQHGGVVVRPRGEGDSRFIVFTHATDAALVAAAIQRAMHAEDWQTPKPLKVRMGLHTGEADVRTGDYYGSTVNRCARLRSLASGGQILISRATAELVRDDLPDNLRLRDFGEHRLKGLSRPEHIFQLSVVGLPDDFPTLKSLDAFPNNLPAQLTTFIGRERESADIKRLLGETHLLTLTGSGGTGKTRLAIENAGDVLAEYPDGLWLVELAPVADPAHVPDVLAGVLGIRQIDSRPLAQTISGYIGDKTMLLILDNCEHVIDSAAQFADMLLRTCPNLKILATSREPLGVAGETTWRVPSLVCPYAAVPQTVDELAHYDAVTLFLDRARAAKPDFALTDGNAAAVVQICRRLDGIPLAIELASTRIRGLTVEQIAKRLDDRFKLLVGGSRTVLPRHQTLFALIDWSYDLLPEEECGLLRRLSVFVGGWTLEGAEAVCGEAGSDVLDLLLQLVNKSLVVVDERDEETRYHLLETIRQYARDKLLAAGEAADARDRHLEYYLHWVEDIDAKWSGFSGGVQLTTRVWRQLLETEQDNLRAALDWAIGNEREDASLRLVWTLYLFWNTQGYWTEGVRWSEMALAIPGDKVSAVRVRAMLVLAGLIGRMGDGPRHAGALMQEIEPLLTQVDDHKVNTGFYLNLGFMSPDYEQARDNLEKAIAESQAFGSVRSPVVMLGFLADRARIAGDFELATRQFQEVVEAFHTMGDPDEVAYAVGNLGRMAFVEGDYARARASFEQAVALMRGTDRVGLANWLLPLATLALAQADYAQARACLHEGLILYRDINSRSGIGHNLLLIAGLAIGEEKFTQAARLLGAASQAIHEGDIYLEPMLPAQQAAYAETVKTRLGPDVYEAAYAAGRHLTRDEAVTYALDMLKESD